MALQPLEIPTGTINGSNTSFIASQTIYQFDTILVDGSEYFGAVTISGAGFTLADAPTFSIYISFYTTPPSEPGTLAGTLDLNTAFEHLTALKKDTSDIPQATFIKWCNYINFYIYRIILRLDPERLINTTTYTTSPGVQNYALPTDFRDISVLGTGMFPQSGGTPTDPSLTLTGFGSQYGGFYISRGNIVFTPTPVSSKTYTFRYIPAPPVLTLMTDRFIAPIAVEYIEYVLKALDVFYNYWDEQKGEMAFSDSLWHNVLDEFLRTVRIEPQAIGLNDYQGYDSFSYPTIGLL